MKSTTLFYLACLGKLLQWPNTSSTRDSWYLVSSENMEVRYKQLSLIQDPQILSEKKVFAPSLSRIQTKIHNDSGRAMNNAKTLRKSCDLTQKLAEARNIQ